MKITNRTKWRTDHLRAFITRVAQDELDARDRKRVHVEVVYNRAGKAHSYVSGHAYVGKKGEAGFVARSMVIKVGAWSIDRIDLAITIAHEMAHLRGLGHWDMRQSPRYTRVSGNEVGSSAVHYIWALDLPMEPQPTPVRPALADRRAARLEHATRMVAKWTQKELAARRRLMTWRVRMVRMERAIAVAAQAPPREGGA